ncbi:PQQ-binding-like beta-propeller repeat protein [Halosimplex sp. J119]
MPSDRPPREADTHNGETDRTPSADQRASTRRRVLQTIGVVGAVGVTGCSNVTSFGGPSPEWRQSLSNASTASPPAAGDEFLLVGAQDKQLHAFDPATGDRAFAYKTGGLIDSRPVAASGGSAHHVRSTDGDVYAVDSSGDLLWSHEGVHRRGHLAKSGPLVVENVPVYDDPTVRGFDAQTGATRFTLSTSSHRLPGLTAAGFALPLPSDGDQSRVTVLSLADGSVRWETDPRPPYVSAVADESLVVTYHDATLTAYAIDDGTRQWRQTLADTEHQAGPYLGTAIYLTHETDSGDEIVALDRKTGQRRWQQPAGYQIRHVEPGTDAVFVGSRVDDPDGGVMGRIDCFEPDGTRRWKTTAAVPDVSDIAALGETVLLASDRQLVAFDRSTGTTAWTHEPDSYSRLGLATDSNSVYVSYLDDGAVAKFSVS